MAKEKYIAPTTQQRVLEVAFRLLEVSAKIPDENADTTDDPFGGGVKQEFDFSQGGFDENPWQD